MGEILKLSTLRIEPHRVKPDTSREYYVRKEGVVLWHVWLNSELLAENAIPFDSTDTIIQLTTDRNFPLLGDGDDYVYVRRIANYILWTESIEFDPGWGGNAGVEEMYIFSVSHYDAVCTKALTETSARDEHYNHRKRDVSWQMLEPRELTALLKINRPNWIDDIAIYREPVSRLDRTGSIIWRRMKKAIDNLSDFVPCDPPEKQVELRIGLDDDEFKEAIWHVGKVDGQFAVWFEQYPTFPLWIRCAAFDTVFRQESFVKGLA